MIGLQAEEAEALCWAGRWDAALALAAAIEEPLAAADQILDLATLRAIARQDPDGSRSGGRAGRPGVR